VALSRLRLLAKATPHLPWCLTVLPYLPPPCLPCPDFLPCCRPRLAGTMFQKDLGSLLDKSQRVEALVPALGAAAGLEGGRAGGLWRGGCGGNAVNALVCGSVGLFWKPTTPPASD
jgi:hypothetical protein